MLVDSEDLEISHPRQKQERENESMLEMHSKGAKLVREKDINKRERLCYCDILADKPFKRTTLTGVRWVRSGIIFVPLLPNEDVEDLLIEAMPPFPLEPDETVATCAPCFCTPVAVVV